ncbi:hypothetical protein LWI28_025291 [Acer negundo]|uniref:Retrovirus-related Pol polyprotein from transposon TNT 1-94 n=1 Tax=Acer negundo TaxID=4023 RepID=A0AAD5NYB0_ACENE|nr:hypothetical protein LWI28_025291 [Acer negundo]
MQDSKKGMLPFRHGIKLSKEQVPKNEHEEQFMSRVPYASAVGSLMYAMLCTRPDICFAVGIILISNQILTPENPHQGLCLLLEEEQLYGGVSSNLVLLIPPWKLSMLLHAKLPKRLFGSCQFLIDLEVVPSANKQITIYCDNSGAVANSKEPRSHKRGKHIERKYHLLREIVQRGDVTITKIASAENLARSLHKGSTSEEFRWASREYGLERYDTFAIAQVGDC